jgi:hypothetical protein
MAVIDGLQTGHCVVKDALSNLKRDAKFSQPCAKRAAQIVQARINQTGIIAHALDPWMQRHGPLAVESKY